VRWTPQGHRRLKGVVEPVRLYEVRRSDEVPSRPVDPVCGMELDEDQCGRPSDLARRAGVPLLGHLP